MLVYIKEEHVAELPEFLKNVGIGSIDEQPIPIAKVSNGGDVSLNVINIRGRREGSFGSGWNIPANQLIDKEDWESSREFERRRNICPYPVGSAVWIIYTPTAINRMSKRYPVSGTNLECYGKVVGVEANKNKTAWFYTVQWKNGELTGDISHFSLTNQNPHNDSLRSYTFLGTLHKDFGKNEFKLSRAYYNNGIVFMCCKTFDKQFKSRKNVLSGTAS